MEYVTNLIKKANKIVVLTGAGISTESGIPDFRSKQGIYNQAPEKILSRNFFFNYPNIFYEFLFDKIYNEQAKPNEGHKIITKWQKEGKVSCIITQNIDGLHQESGSEKVIEFHGTIKTATCYNPKCQKKYTIEEMIKRKSEKEEFWVCDCGKSSTKRFIKPDVVLYDDIGKWFTKEGFKAVTEAVREGDLILILGTSLKVYPFANLPNYRTTNTPIVVINEGETTIDYNPTVEKINKKIGETLTSIDRKLKK